MLKINKKRPHIRASLFAGVEKLLVAELHLLGAFYDFTNLRPLLALGFEMSHNFGLVCRVDEDEHAHTHVEGRVHFVLFDRTGLLDELEDHRRIPRSAVDNHIDIVRQDTRNVALIARTRNVGKALNNLLVAKIDQARIVAAVRCSERFTDSLVHTIDERIDLVEPDEMMVEVSKKYFPEQTAGFDDPRVHIYFQDGLHFLRSVRNEYDIIVNDSTDPFGHEEGLFTKEFYGSCYKALKADGIMVYQHGSPFYDVEEEACRSMHRKVFHSFPISHVYQAHIATCSAGYWLFGFASKKYHPIQDFDPKRWNDRGLKTWYYTTNLHIGSFMLPKYVEDLLEEEEDRKKD